MWASHCGGFSSGASEAQASAGEDVTGAARGPDTPRREPPAMDSEYYSGDQYEWSSGFPHFLQFKSEFGNKEFMI